MLKFKIYFWKKIPKDLLIYGNEKSNKKDYMRVFIFDTFEEMYTNVDKLEKNKTNRDYSARCYCFTKLFLNNETQERQYTPLSGNLYFAKEQMGGGTVSHECSHAVIGYFNRKIDNYNKLFEKLDFTNEILYENCMEHEELFCYMMGSLVNQVYNYYWKVSDGNE